jgi:hypothetical protein
MLHSLFAKPNATDIHQFAEILKLFGDASGITAYLQKCDIYLLICNIAETLYILNPLPVPIKHFPCHYLGLPLHHKKLNKAELQPLVTK